MQLAGVPGVFPCHAGSRYSFQGHWTLVAHLRLRLIGPGPRCRQHVHHPNGYLGRNARRYRATVHLERYAGLMVASCGRTCWKACPLTPQSAGIFPATLGNMLGGALFCGTFYWWMFSCGEEPIAVDGVYYESHLAMPTLPKDEHIGGGSDSEHTRCPV